MPNGTGINVNWAGIEAGRAHTDKIVAMLQAIQQQKLKEKLRQQELQDAIRLAEEKAKIGQKYRSPYEAAQEEATLAKTLQAIEAGKRKRETAETEAFAFGLDEEVPERFAGRLPRTFTGARGRELTIPPGVMGKTPEGLMRGRFDGRIATLTPEAYGKFQPKPEAIEQFRGQIKGRLAEKERLGKVWSPSAVDKVVGALTAGGYVEKLTGRPYKFRKREDAENYALSQLGPDWKERVPQALEAINKRWPKAETEDWWNE